MATVICLPIERESATATVKSQIESLLSSRQPVLLFLDRICELTIEVISKGSVRRTTLSRQSGPAAAELGGECRLELISLFRRRIDESNAKNELHGSYALITKKVDRPRLERAIQESIQGKFIEEKFAEWEEDAFVSVATRLDADDDSHCMYTFLPMPDAGSPFSGHLNAPFAPKLDRKDLNPKIPLNEMLLEVAAEICAETIPALRNKKFGIGPTAIVDLLTWKPDQFARFSKAFSRLNVGKKNWEPCITVDFGKVII